MIAALFVALAAQWPLPDGYTEAQAVRCHSWLVASSMLAASEKAKAEEAGNAEQTRVWTARIANEEANVLASRSMLIQLAMSRGQAEEAVVGPASVSGASLFTGLLYEMPEMMSLMRDQRQECRAYARAL